MIILHAVSYVVSKPDACFSKIQMANMSKTSNSFKYFQANVKWLLWPFRQNKYKECCMPE